MTTRRPADLVEGTRWLFGILTLVSLLVILVAPLNASSATTRTVALISAATLCLSWYAGYRWRRTPWFLDVLDTLAIVAFAATLPVPNAALGFVFAAIWFRTLYGSAGRAVLRCALYSAAMIGSGQVWSLMPGHGPAAAVTGALVGNIPNLFLTVIVGRYVAGNMRSREQATQRDAVLLSLATHLLGVADTVQIRQSERAALVRICAATPGLRVVRAVRTGTALGVEYIAGSFVERPDTLPAATLSLSTDTGGGSDPGATVHDVAALNAAAGATCVWACVEVPTVGTGREIACLLLGATGAAELRAAVIAVTTLTSQVVVALRNSSAHEDLTTLATVDGLTGLANRTTFTAAVAAALVAEPWRPTTVLCIDMDNFKQVNDAFGHAAGDSLLRETARRLRLATRAQDLCGRLGGDELAVHLNGIDGETAVQIAQRIVEALEVPFQFPNGVGHGGASVGLATATAGIDVEQLLNRADSAMYAAKTHGKGQLRVFSPTAA